MVDYSAEGRRQTVGSRYRMARMENKEGTSND
jgi:hypothetical protein